MINIKNLYLAFLKEYDALHNINLKVEKGEKVALVGDTDSGKTMLLRVIAGLEKFKSGEVYLNGLSLDKINFSQDLQLGFVPKNFVFLNNKTVKENLEYVLKMRNYDMATVNIKVLTALKYFNLESVKDLKIKHLTNFQKTVVQLARVSMRKVDLFLIDNILTDFTESEVETLIKHMQTLLNDNQESTFVFAFNTEDYAKKFNLRVIKLKYGCIEEEEKKD